jgi:hypothetical protein
MKYVKVAVAALQVSGVLHLTDAQAEGRKAMLKPLGDNRFATLVPVNFKTGEIFGLEAELPGTSAFELTMTAGDFERRVRGEREAAAKAKAEVLRGRSERDAALKRAAAQRAKEAEAKKAAAVKARDAKAKADADAAKAPSAEVGEAPAAEPKGLLARAGDLLKSDKPE